MPPIFFNPSMRILIAKKRLLFTYYNVKIKLLPFPLLLSHTEKFTNNFVEERLQKEYLKNRLIPYFSISFFPAQSLHISLKMDWGKKVPLP